MHPTKRESRQICRKLLVSLAVGASATAGTAFAQTTGLPTRLPSPIAEVAPPPQPETTVTPNGTALIVPLGGSRQLRMKSGKPIRTVYNQQEDVATVDATTDRTKVLISGKKAGTSHLTLLAEDNTKEVLDVVVQPDVQYLRSLLAQAVPTANLRIIPAASGTVIINGTVTHAEDIEIIMNTAKGVMGAPGNVINALRVGGVQTVQLDVVIATVDRSKFRDLGFEFNSYGVVHSFASTFTPPAPLAGAVGSALTGIGQNANIATGLFNYGSGRTLLGFLTALSGESVSKMLAEPRVLALSGHVANFYSGGEQAVPTISGGSASATAGVDFKPFGTTLSVLPIVLGDGKIYLEIDPKVDTPSSDPILGAPIPGTNSSVAGRTGQEVHTSVVMEDGQTFVIGGLIQHTMSASIKRVPILGECPLFGALFTTKTLTDGEEELVILVTPHLVDAASCCQMPKYLPGQETRNPDDFELFYEGILEAPRGPREVFVNGQHVPAYQNQVTADPANGPVSEHVSSNVGTSSDPTPIRSMSESASGHDATGTVATPVTTPTVAAQGGGL